MPDIWGLKIELAPEDIRFELEKDIRTATEDFFRDLKTELPIAARDVIDRSSPSGKVYRRKSGEGFLRFHQTSAPGEPPAKDSFELYNSFRSFLKGAEAVVLEMAGHGFYLDPLFEGQGKGGGYLNRPFLEASVDLAVSREIPKSL